VQTCHDCAAKGRNTTKLEVKPVNVVTLAKNIILYLARNIGDKDEMHTVSTLQPPRKCWVGFAKMSAMPISAQSHHYTGNPVSHMKLCKNAVILKVCLTVRNQVPLP
jgi:hypothetical protein